MPGPGEKVVFNETNKCIKHPFVICAEFESILEKTDGSVTVLGTICIQHTGVPSHLFH